MATDYIDELIEKAGKVLKESAKPLTTKQRKKMKKSTFCGPGRSFPVNDCLHVRVAKTYLGRSKFSKSTKQKIAACINRKAKQMGCKITKKAKAADRDYPFFRELSAEEKRMYSSDLFEETKELVEQSIDSPGLELWPKEIQEKVT